MTAIIPELAPVADPPTWATSGPDPEGAYEGPSVEIESGRIVGSTIWTPTGPAAWFDAKLSTGAGLTPYELRMLALWATTAANILETSR